MLGVSLSHPRALKKQLRNFGHMSKLDLPYVPSNMDKKKFGQVLFCLPYLPTQRVWTF